jgi:hypothetical protein
LKKILSVYFGDLAALMQKAIKGCCKSRTDIFLAASAFTKETVFPLKAKSLSWSLFLLKPKSQWSQFTFKARNLFLGD